MNREFGVDVPLLLMNSFNTHEDTVKLIEKFNQNQVTIQTFNQSQYPRIVRDTLLPLPKDAVGQLEDWYEISISLNPPSRFSFLILVLPPCLMK